MTGLKGDANPAKRPEVRKKISDAMKGRDAWWSRGELSPMKNPESRAKISRALKGRKHSAEHIRKLSESLKRRWSEDSEFRARMIAIRQTPEYRAKESESNRRTWSSPELRARHSARTTGKKMPESYRAWLREHHPMRKHGVAARVAEKNRWRMLGELNPAKRPETRKKISNAAMGRPAPPGSGIGKGSICKKGHWVRSTWERSFADWLFDEGIPYEYEPHQFQLAGGVRYRPDFYLPSYGTYVEVKGWWRPGESEKIDLFRAAGHKIALVVRDIAAPYDGEPA